MKISKWVSGVATGRIRHWNDINNQLVADLWKDIETLDEPYLTAFKGAMVSSLQVAERMLGVEVGEAGWMRVDLLHIQRKTMERVYFILMDIFIGLDAKTFPSLEIEIHLARGRLFKTKGIVSDIYMLLQKEGDYIESAAKVAWKEIAQLLNSEMVSHPIAIFQFHAFVLASATNNAKELQKLRGTKEQPPQGNTSSSDNREAVSPPKNKRPYTRLPSDDYSSGNVAATHTGDKVLARKGAVGGTARWAAKGYHACIRDDPNGGISVVFHELLDARYLSQPDLLGLVNKNAVMDLVCTDPDNKLLRATYWPGLQRLVVCILTVEAGFAENTLTNQRMFNKIINEELMKQGVPIEFIDNTKSPIYYDDDGNDINKI